MNMSFSDYYVNHRTRKGNFLSQIDHLIDWTFIEKRIEQYYASASDVTGRPAYPDYCSKHSVLSCFRTRLTAAQARDDLLKQVTFLAKKTFGG